MKKIFLSSLCLIFAALSFIACGDDDNGPIKSTNPSADAAGKYVGTWKVKITKTVMDASGKASFEEVFNGNSDGNIEVSSNGSPYVANIKMKADDEATMLSADNLSIVENISAVSNGFGFFNVVGNVFGYSKQQIFNDEGRLKQKTDPSTQGVNGQIDENGVVTLSFYVKYLVEDYTYRRVGSSVKQSKSSTTTEGKWEFTGKKE